MIDMGNHRGHHVFYAGGRSYAELIAADEILAIPHPIYGIVYKRPERCTELEKAAAFTLEEATAFAEEWNKRIDEQEQHND